VYVWLAQTAYSLAFFALLVVLLIAPWIDLQYRRFGTFRGWPAIVSAATVLYVCALVAFTMFPLPRTTPGFCDRQAGVTHWQLTPFASLDDVSAYASDHTLLQTLTSGVMLQVVMNVVFFVPLGFLLAYRYRRGLLLTAAVAFGVSVVIELTQGTGLWGLAACPYRLADVDDLMTNTLGGVLGWVLARMVGRWLPDPVPQRRVDTDPPTRRRRALAVVLDLWVYALVQIGVTLALRVAGSDLPAGTWPTVISGLLTSFLLVVVIPMLRWDRAGPGAASVDIALCRSDGRPAAPWSLAARWLVRWVPLALFGLLAWVVLLPLDLLVSLRRRDGRSATDLAGGSRWLTREAVARSREVTVSSP
jgi:glycopeptide antibiotics resistance protein